MNMRTVAQRAGVSSATVSRVINGLPLVKEETAKRVREVIEEMNFLPSPAATTLKYGRSRTYGLIVPDITNPFYPEFLCHFEEILVENDHEILLANTRSSATALQQSVRRMLMRQVDGVVIMASEFDTQAIEPLLAHKVPLVTIDRRRTEEGISDVAINFEAGLFQAVKQLKALGHTRLAFVGGQSGLRTSKVRLQAFKRGLERCGLEVYEQFLFEGNYRVDGGEQAVRSLLAAKSWPTAILTANDLTAFGVIKGLHDRGLHIPRDMSVVGLDDVPLSEIIQPSLTTIRIERREMAMACLKALDFTKLYPEAKGKLFPIRSALVVRESTGAPRRGSRPISAPILKDT